MLGEAISDLGRRASVAAARVLARANAYLVSACVGTRSAMSRGGRCTTSAPRRSRTSFAHSSLETAPLTSMLSDIEISETGLGGKQHFQER